MSKRKYMLAASLYLSVLLVICQLIFPFFQSGQASSNAKNADTILKAKGKDRPSLVIDSLQSKIVAHKTPKMDSISLTTDASVGDGGKTGGGGGVWEGLLKSEKLWIAIVGAVLAAILGLFFARSVAKRQKQGRSDAEKREERREAEDDYEKYSSSLKRKYGVLSSAGLDDYDDIQIPVEDIFIDLHITDDNRNISKKVQQYLDREKPVTQDKLLQKAFQGEHKAHLLLLVGDPGSGKTTLLQHYAMLCLNGDHKKLFPQASSIRIIFLELRKLIFNGDEVLGAVAEQIAGQNKPLAIEEKSVRNWLFDEDKEKMALVLLDGLDEVTELKKRIEVCNWIDRESTFYQQTFFVVTTRGTGYSKADGVELRAKHHRASVKDFSREQQKDFLLRWFTEAAKIEESNEKPKGQDKSPEKEAAELFEYLHPSEEAQSWLEKKGLQQLAGVPLLLKLMALLYKRRRFKPDSRIELYRVALDYLILGRERSRELALKLKPGQAQRIISPLAYTMHLEKKLEEKEEWMKEIMEPKFKDQNFDVALAEFFNYLVDRGGIIIAYGDAYRFRHKTFQEYLASIEMVNQSKSVDFIGSIVSHYGNKEWEWDETLRFYFARIDADVFDVFMERLFVPTVTTDLLSSNLQLMKTMIQGSAESRTDALCKKLFDPELALEIKWYVLDCLEEINKLSALDDVQRFLKEGLAENSDDQKETKKLRDKANEVLSKLVKTEPGKQVLIPEEVAAPPSSRNPYEHDAQYILIPGGKYIYSQPEPDGQEVTVPDLYVAKYPVTNKQYRSFIDFLAGKATEYNSALSLKSFQDVLHGLARSKDDAVKGFDGYLKEESNLVERFRSEYDDGRKFNKDDQPVVGVSWYAARAYCLWLSMLVGEGPEYRLPDEKEWEWVAGGQRDKPDQVLKVREYPWGDEPEPTSKHANYDENESATTPVGSYPDGATPEGLYDMAGNVWEWMENFYDDDKHWKALRGGSWGGLSEGLACSYRNDLNPDDGYSGGIGFRVVRPSPSS